MIILSAIKKASRLIWDISKQFAINLTVALSLPLIRVLGLLFNIKIFSSYWRKNLSITENPAGKTLQAYIWRVAKKIQGEPLGDPSTILKKISNLAKGSHPIIIGPWLSEVGFELLYWIPFLQWFVKKYEVDPSRLLIVSRGGVKLWYSYVSPHYIDILDHVPPQEFFHLNKMRIQDSGNQKQIGFGKTDHTLLDRVVTNCDIKDYQVLHPSIMYQLLLPLWRRSAPSKLAHLHAIYKPMIRPDLNLLPKNLPSGYTAAKFYFSDAFPKTDDNMMHIRNLLRSYLLRGPVVMLTSGIKIDDHIDLIEGLPEGVFSLQNDVPSRNLLLQTAVVAAAERFVGTFGGFSYLAPMLGVPSFCVFSDFGRLMPMHMDVALRVFRQFNCGELESGCPTGTIGEMPTGRFSAVHVDALKDIPWRLANKN